MHIKLVILLISLSVFLKTAYSAVIGIDFGQEFFKICLISPGKSFAIVENMQSKRKTHTALSFSSGERIYGQDAITKRSRYSENTFVFIQKYLKALSKNEKVVQLSKQNYENYIMKRDADVDVETFLLKDFSFADENLGEQIYLDVQEITAMILRYGKRLAEKMAKIEIKDCIITVPSNWDLDQRLLLDESAKLAGLQPLGFIHENSAAALYYSIDRQDVNETHTVLFYNLGSSGLKVNLAEFHAVNLTNDKANKKPIETVKILADYVDEEISSLAFDHILAQHFADEFDKLPQRKGKTSIKTSPQGMIRLIQNSQKLKEVLSANKEAPFYVETLFEGVDFKSHMTRSTFEEKSQHIFDQLTKSIDIVLKQANRTLSQIDRLEIIGGGVRIPKVQAILQEYLQGKELGAHLNGDECMAFGAAFQAANLSHSFKVRPIWLFDGFPQSFRLVMKNLDQDLAEDQQYHKDLVIFPAKQRFGSKKVLSFTYDQNIQCIFYKINEDSSEELIKVFNFTNISSITTDKRYSNFTKPKLHFQFGLNSISGIELELAEATVEQEKEYEQVDTTTSQKSKSKSKKEKSKDKDTDDKKSKTESDEDDNDDEDEKDVEPVKEKKIIKKNITHYIGIQYTEFYAGIQGLNKTEFQKSTKKLKHFDQHEELLHKNAESKNKLETFIYKWKDYKEDENFIKHATEQEKTELDNLCQENDDWLYSDEAAKSNFTVFNKRYNAMQVIEKRILTRVEQSQQRPAAVENAHKSLADYQKKVDGLQKTMPWLTEKNKKPVLKEISDTKKWLEAKVAKQQGLKPYEDAAFTISEIKFRIEEVKEKYLDLKAIKKPKPPKNETNNKTENATSSSKTTSDDSTKKSEESQQETQNQDKTTDTSQKQQKQDKPKVESDKKNEKKYKDDDEDYENDDEEDDDDDEDDRSGKDDL